MQAADGLAGVIGSDSHPAIGAPAAANVRVPSGEVPPTVTTATSLTGSFVTNVAGTNNTVLEGGCAESATVAVGFDALLLVPPLLLAVSLTTTEWPTSLPVRT